MSPTDSVRSVRIRWSPQAEDEEIDTVTQYFRSKTSQICTSRYAKTTCLTATFPNKKTRDAACACASKWLNTVVDYTFDGMTVLRTPGSIELDICAIHGLEGNAADSFTSTSKLWLRDLLPNEASFSSARISTFGYNSRLFDRGSTDRLFDWADYLLEAASNLRVSTSTSAVPMIFVCHSMGGLVVRKAIENLFRYPTDLKYAGLTLGRCGILFLSTPHEGTVEADYNEFLTGVLKTTFGLRKTDIVRELKSFNDSAAEAKREWDCMSQLKRVPPFECLTESTNTKLAMFKSVVLVRQSSASFGGKLAAKIPGADHHSVCKFEDIFSQGYKMVITRLQALQWNLDVESTLEHSMGTAQKLLSNAAPGAALLEVNHEKQIPVDADHSAMCKFETDKRVKKMENRPRRITNENSVSHNEHFEVPHSASPVSTGRAEDLQCLTASFAARQPSQTPSAQITLAPSASTATSNETGTDANIDLLPNSSLNATGWTIVHASVNCKSVEGVTAILAMGHDPNVQTVEGWTPLYLAACRGLLEISRLLVEAGANVNTANREGSTPLREAAQTGAAELVQFLVEHGANVELKPHTFQDTPLIDASAKNHIEVVKILLAAGADSQAQHSGGWSSLHYALLNKNEEMATLILGHDPNINASTRGGLRPLHLAASAGFTDICARLLRLGAEIEAMDSGGLTALRGAVQAGQLETVRLLVERGSRTDVVEAEDRHTLSEVALISGHLSVLQYLEEQRTR